MKITICCLIICFGFIVECFPQDHFYYSIKIHPSDTVKISHSYFRGFKDGEFPGEVKGILYVSMADGDKKIEFGSNDVKLTILPDTLEIYDVSTKKYICFDISKHNELNYTTYAGSNALSLNLDNVKYGISGIDGACISCIKGLDFKYKSDENEEKLFMNFIQKVQLSNPTNCFNSYSIYVNPGSSLVFTINKKNK